MTGITSKIKPQFRNFHKAKAEVGRQRAEGK
jgi:hypothetical protein